MQVLLSPVIEQGLNLHLQCASVLLGSSFTAHGAIAEPSGGGGTQNSWVQLHGAALEFLEVTDCNFY